jgi:hypothetical protein
VEYASVHIFFDYNRFARLGKCSLLLTKDFSQKLRYTHRYFKALAWFFLILGFVALFILDAGQKPAAARQLNSATPTSTGGSIPAAYITVTYLEGTNVRTGPGSFDYPAIGHIPEGGTALATGRSPAGEWIQIEFPDAPYGKGWVYAANVTLSAGALLPIVEPPPTPAPLETPTLNPTFVAAFQILPTSTRLPTFTAPPALLIPTFTNPAVTSSRRAIAAWVIIILGLTGILGMIVTLFRRR